MIEPDDFAIWQSNPITQTLFKALTNMAAEAKAKWLNDTWSSGTVDERLLIDLKATAQVCEDIVGMTLKDLEEQASG